MRFYFLLFFSVCLTVLHAQYQHDCSVEDPTPEQQALMINDILTQNIPKNSSTVCIPVLPHIITKTDGTGSFANLGTINKDIANLNHHFLGAGLEFFLVDGAPNVISDDYTFFNFDNTIQANIEATHGDQNSINIIYYSYCLSCPPASVGSSPQIYPGSIVDAQAILVKSPYSGAPNINNGFRANTTMVHEMGHYFNLHHTYIVTGIANNIANPTNASENVARTGPQANCGTIGGDYMCDTEADPGFIIEPNHGIWGGNNTLSGLLVDIHNVPYVVGDVYKNNMRQGRSTFLRMFTPDQENAIWLGYNYRINTIGYNYNSLPSTVTDPNNLVVSDVEYGKLLNWSDNSNNETGFLIERSSNSAISGFKAVVNGGIGNNITSFIDYSVESDQQYWYRVKASNDNCNDYSNVYHLQNSGSVYCIPLTADPTPSSCTSQNCMFSITNVDISEEASGNSIMTNPTNYDGNLSNYLSSSIQIPLSGCYELNVSLSEYSSEFNIWIDWNQDGDFDDLDEAVHHSINNGSTRTAQILVPVHASLGNTRMRIRSSNIEFAGGTLVPASPCNFQYFSETEDYNLEIITGAGFEFDYNCGNLSASFTSAETNPAAIHLWDFGTPLIPNSSVANPIAQFPDNGTYIVTHTVNIGGETFVSQKSVGFVNAGFVATEVCGTNTYIFTSDYVSGNHLWDFGNGNIINSINTSFAFSGPGPFTVTHTVTSTNCSDVSTQQIQFTPIIPTVFNPILQENVICEGQDLVLSYTGNVTEISLDNGATWITDNPVTIPSNHPYFIVEIDGRNTNNPCVNQSYVQAILDFAVQEIPIFNDDYYIQQICPGESVSIPYPYHSEYEPININGNVQPVIVTLDGIVTSQPDWPISFSPTVTTSYTFEAITPLGCISTDVITIEVLPEAPNFTITAPQIICNGDLVNLSAQSTGGQADVIQWLEASNLTEVSNTTTYNYTASQDESFIFSSSNTCGQFEETVNLNLQDLTVSAISSNNISCFGANDGGITITCLGQGPITYSIDNGLSFQSTNTFNNLQPGTYEITVNNGSNCPINYLPGITQTIVLTEPNELLVSDVIVEQPFCNTNDEASIVINTIGSSNLEYSLDGLTQSSNEFTNLPPGYYIISVTDLDNSCPINFAPGLSNSVLINQEFDMTFTFTSPSCFGLNDGAINTYITGGTPPYIFNWSNSATTESLTNIAAGNYTLIATDGNNCSLTQTLTLLDDPELIITYISSSNTSCIGTNDGMITVGCSGNGPKFYSIDNGATFQNDNNFYNLSPGVYNVVVKNYLDCYASLATGIVQTIIITESNEIVVTDILVDHPCNTSNSGSITVLTTGSNNLNYTLNGQSQPINQFNNLDPGSYNLSVSDPINSCPVVFSSGTSSSIVLTEILSASLVIATPTCYGDNDGSIDVTVTGGTSPYSYLWSNASTTEDQFNLSGSANYSVAITDANNCILNTGVQLIEPQGLNVFSNNNSHPTCSNPGNGEINTIVTGGTPPYNILWSNNEITADINGLAPGTYTMNITDANNCIFSKDFLMGDAIVLSQNSVVISPSCYGGVDGSIDLSVSGGVGPYSYSWSNSATTQDLSNLNAGTYTVDISDNNNCSITETFTLSTPLELSISNISQNPTCNDASNGAIDITITGGAPPYTFAWSNSLTSEDLTGLTAGTYSVLVSDANNCTASESYTLTDPSVLTLTSITTNLICNSSLDGSIDLTISGGTPPYSFIWSNSMISEDLNNLAAGIYSVDVTDANNCSITESITLTEPSPFAVTVNSTADVCFGSATGSIDVTVSGATPPYTYLWSNTAIDEDLTNLPADSYDVTIEDNNGCITTANAVISEFPEIVISNITVTEPLCLTSSEGSIEVTVSGGTPPFMYSLDGITFTPNNLIEDLPIGSYTVSIMDANSCVTSQIVDITAPQVIANAPAIISNTVNNWTSSSYVVANSITVPSNTTLNITNSNVYFGLNAALIVESGGNLTVNGSLLTAYCDDTWPGIRFEGSNGSQLIVNNNSTISYAIIGIEATANATNENANLNVSNATFEFNQFAIRADGTDDAAVCTINNSFFINPLDVYYYDYFPNASGFEQGEMPFAYIDIENYVLVTLTNNILELPVLDENPINAQGPPIYRSYSNVETALFLSSDNAQSNFILDGNDFTYWKRAVEIFTEGIATVTNGAYNSSHVDHSLYYIKAYGNGELEVVNADFYATRPNNEASIILHGLEDSRIENNTFHNNKRAIYSTSPGVIISNNFLNIPEAFTDNNPNTIDDTYGMFIIGEEPRFIAGNNFEGIQTATSPDPGLAASYSAIFEQTGNTYVNFFDNNMHSTDIGLQVEGANNNLKVRCNHFASDGVEHAVGAWTLIENITPTNTEPGSLRFQGLDDCDENDVQAGNEWHDPAGIGLKNDVLFGPYISYFSYFCHGEVDPSIQNGGRTVPNEISTNVYNDWSISSNTPLAPCAIGQVGYIKIANSCNDETLGLIDPGNTNGTTTTQLLATKLQLEADKSTKEALLTDPANQVALVREITILATRLSTLVIEIAQLYIDNGQMVDAIILLESEDYPEAKRMLTEIYRNENNYTQSRDAQDELETIVNNRPDYYYANLEERERYEYNQLYFREINELLIEVKEDFRTESELLYWELYALKLIEETGLPVAIEAGRLLRLNRQETTQHTIEKIPSYFLANQQVNGGVFDYELTLTPNPAMFTTQAHVVVPSNAINPKLLLVDVYSTGQILQTQTLIIGTNTPTFNVQNYNSGMYSIVLEIDGVAITSEHLIIIN